MIQLKINGNVIAILVPELVNMVITGLLNSGLNPQNGFQIEASPLKMEQKDGDTETKKAKKDVA